jgi:DNA-binding beta-propeller fold protein YncE
MAKLHGRIQRRACLPITVLIALSGLACARRADPAPKPQPPPPFEFVDSWGDKGEDPGKLDAPTAFAIDALGNVFFADPGTSFVDKFASKGTPLLSFEDPRLRRASGITVDSGGAIYVADAERGSILIFFPDGTFFKAMQISAQPHFSGALGISVDENGKLYVPDPAHSRIAKFDTRGRLMKSWAVSKNATPDERPTAVAAVKDESVFVAFANTTRIEKYSSDGAWVATWIASDSSAGSPLSMTGFTVTDQFVFTLTGRHIRVWTLDGQRKVDADLGEHLGTGSNGSPNAGLQIGVTPHEELLVFDPSAPRVFRFRMHLEHKDQDDLTH